MAQNVNINRDTGASMLDNMPANGLMDYHDGTREYKPGYPRPDWRVEAARGALALSGVLVLWLAFGAWKSLYCWNAVNWQRCDGINNAEPLAVGLLFVGAASLACWRTVSRILIDVRLAAAWAARAATSYNRWGNPVRIDLYDAPEYQPGRYAADAALKLQTAPYEWAHSINNYSPSNQGQPAAALPAPVDVALVPPDQWLAWVNETPHVILAAETGGGKSTTAKRILAPRIEAGEHVFIIDPHSDDWFGLPAIGGGENWSEVADAIDALIAEYQRRMQERDRFLKAEGRAMPVGDWTRLTTLMDEGFMARLQLDTAPRGQTTRWEQFTKVLGSGARKVGISVGLLTQSANVEDLGLSGPMRRNFLRVGLDHAVVRQMLKDEPNADRRKAIQGLMEGRQYPAVCEFRGQFHALDRAGLEQASAPADAQAAWWPGWTGGVTAAAAPRDPIVMGLLRQARAAGWTRDEVRASGVRFTNEMWTDAV